MILGNTVGKIAICFPTEGSSSKNKFVCADAQRPPVDGVCIPFLCQYLWSHIRHRPCDTGEKPTFRIMHSNVEVSDVSVTALVQQDIVGFQVSTQSGNKVSDL